MLHDVKNPLADWRRLLEGYFECVQRYLEKCPGEIASTIPCPGSNLRLEVGKREGMYVAYPAEGFEGDAESLADLTEADVALWRFECGRFELDLCRALGLTPLERTDCRSKLLSLIGTAGQHKSYKRVYLGYAANERDGVDVCLAAAHESQAPCCVALPAFYPACDDLLRRSNFEYIVLEDMVTLGVSGMVGKPLHFPDVAIPGAESVARAGPTLAAGMIKLDAIANTTAKTLKHVEAMRPHVAGVPPLIEKADEALANPMAAADEMRRQWPLTPEETKIRDAIIAHGGTGKGAAAALGLSEATLSRKRHIIRKKMIAAGFPGDIVFRPSAGHKVHVKKSDDTGGKRAVDYQPPADDWSEDPGTRRRLIRDYLSASPEDQEAMRRQYPDIEAEASEAE